MDAELRSGRGPSTRIGKVNDNRQKNHGKRGRPGNDHLQYSYKLECLECGHCYGVNGSDIHKRKCPACQGGAVGIPY